MAKLSKPTSLPLGEIGVTVPRMRALASPVAKLG